MTPEQNLLNSKHTKTTMNTYTEKQLKIWEDSTVTAFRDGCISEYGKLGKATLLGLFVEGFSRSKAANGNMCIFTAGGIELEIHSKSLARALRKARKEREKHHLSTVRNEIKRIMTQRGQHDPVSIALNCAEGDIGYEWSKTDASEKIVFFAIYSGEKWIFTRQTWASKLEFAEIRK